MIQPLPFLTATEYTSVDEAQPVRLKREAATRQAGQYNVIILCGSYALSKQNTARWLAQKVNVPVYKIMLSQLIYYNMEETKQALRLVFKLAKNKPWVLFFDEGAALFGHRTGVSNAHDKYDSELSNYFAGLVEEYKGSVIISLPPFDNSRELIFERYVRFVIP